MQRPYKIQQLDFNYLNSIQIFNDFFENPIDISILKP